MKLTELWNKMYINIVCDLAPCTECYDRFGADGCTNKRIDAEDAQRLFRFMEGVLQKLKEREAQEDPDWIITEEEFIGIIGDEFAKWKT